MCGAAITIRDKRTIRDRMKYSRVNEKPGFRRVFHGMRIESGEPCGNRESGSAPKP